MLDRDTIATQLHTVRDYIRWGVTSFEREPLYFGHGTDNALDEVLSLVGHVLGLGNERLELFMEARLLDNEKRRLLALFEQRIIERKPAAYLTGEAWFAGLRFKVDERVLVPRSPIAELIDQGFEPWLAGRTPGRILDMCTGSGCIGIACAYAFPEAEVVLSDISDDALDVARENIALHDLAEQVRVIASDVFDGLDGRYDLIVSNPPYVDAEDFASMPAEYHAEPALGLASGQDGLDITRRILAGALAHLNDNGLLVVEVGNSWVALEDAFPFIPFTWVEFERGGHGVFIISREELEASGI